MDGFVSRRDAAMAAGVTLDVIRQWKSRGWLDEKGERRRLRSWHGLVAIDDVLQAERDTRRKRARSHRRLDPPRLDEYAA